MIRVKCTLSCTWKVCGENIERVGPAPHHTLLSTTVSARTLRPAGEFRANKKENKGRQKGVLCTAYTPFYLGSRIRGSEGPTWSINHSNMVII